ncbi:MAG: response regulator transcription factor [Anaerolineales bacterium]|nr:response regulator transcription factor [Anaerolineales bacterium]
MYKSINVLLIDDDWAVRQAVSDYLIRHDMSVYQADNPEDAIALAAEVHPDVAVVDIVMPERADGLTDFDGRVGIDVAHKLRERLPDLGIVFLSAYVDRGLEVIQMFMDGHQGIAYILKGSKPQELLDAIMAVYNGRAALNLMSGIKFQNNTPFDLALATMTPEEQENAKLALTSLNELSEPEWQVLDLIGACRTRRQTAKELDLSPRTVGSHMDSIYAKLGLRQALPGLNQLTLLAKICLLHRLKTAKSGRQS